MSWALALGATEREGALRRSSWVRMPWGSESIPATGIRDLPQEPLDLQMQSRGSASRAWGKGPCGGCLGGKEAKVRQQRPLLASGSHLGTSSSYSGERNSLGAQKQLYRGTPWAALPTATLNIDQIWPDPKSAKRGRHLPGEGWAASLRKAWVGGEEMGLRGSPEALGILCTDLLTPGLSLTHRPPGSPAQSYGTYQPNFAGAN